MWPAPLTVATLTLAVPLTLAGAIWAGIRLIQWTKRNREEAASWAIHLDLRRIRLPLHDLLDDD